MAIRKTKEHNTNKKNPTHYWRKTRERQHRHNSTNN